MDAEILVIGGGVAGLSAAINARIRGRSVLVVSNPMEDNPLWQAARVDNYPGLPAVSGAELLTALRRQAEEAGAVFRTGRVLSAMAMEALWYVSVESDLLTAPAAVFCAGASRGKAVPGETELLGRGVSYCATCDGMLYRGKRVAVVGQTEGAREEAAFLERIGCAVTYFHRPREVAILGDTKVEGLVCDGTHLAVDAVFLLRPTLAPDTLFPGIALEGSFVAVDRRMQTNLPGLFAAGDCTGTPLQAAKAAGEGLIAGQSAAAYVTALQRKKG